MELGNLPGGGKEFISLDPDERASLVRRYCNRWRLGLRVRHVISPLLCDVDESFELSPELLSQLPVKAWDNPEDGTLS